jgi:predicted HAD superfamily Cof-like phosphohydrolase
MDETQRGVLAFHKAFGLEWHPSPTLPSKQTIELRLRLIGEELAELQQALDEGNLVEVADALGDLRYVVDGAACACGIDLEPVSREVQRSNMTKVGGHKDAGGKWIKPDTYEPPRLAEVLARQAPLVRDEGGCSLLYW